MKVPRDLNDRLKENWQGNQAKLTLALVDLAEHFADETSDDDDPSKYDLCRSFFLLTIGPVIMRAQNSDHFCQLMERMETDDRWILLLEEQEKSEDYD